jgi:YHS domain-containing protein
MENPMRTPSSRLLGAFLLVTVAGSARGADGPAHGRREDQAALKPYGALVGTWRGSGQPERGKIKGAWQEDAAWAWKLSKDDAALEATIAKGKYLKSVVLRPGLKPKTYTLSAVLADGSSRTFQGEDNGKKALVLSAQGPGDGVRRITLTPLHETRLLMKLEAQDPANRMYHQLGEVGYTREGVAFAAGESGPVCIVTEGRGTMTVSYKGKTYHVCCSGCRDLFNDNPEAVLAEAAEREKAKDKKSAP